MPDARLPTISNVLCVFKWEWRSVVVATTIKKTMNEGIIKMLLGRMNSVWGSHDHLTSLHTLRRRVF